MYMNDDKSKDGFKETQLPSDNKVGSRSSIWIQFTMNDRLAQCTYCARLSKSVETLPFFKANADAPLDTYYCGCRGWN
jgi:hypothetical protein